MSLVIVLDLSSPTEMWFTLETLLGELKKRIDAAINAAKRDDPSIKDKLKKRCWERIGEDHPVSKFRVLTQLFTPFCFLNSVMKHLIF